MLMTPRVNAFPLGPEAAGSIDVHVPCAAHLSLLDTRQNRFFLFKIKMHGVVDLCIKINIDKLHQRKITKRTLRSAAATHFYATNVFGFESF